MAARRRSRTKKEEVKEPEKKIPLDFNFLKKKRPTGTTRKHRGRRR